MIRLVARGFRLPAEERRLALEALLLLAAIRVLLAVLPFRLAMARLGLRPRGIGVGATMADGTDVAKVITRVGRAVRRGAKIAPFRAVCLQQALAAALMLRRRGLSAEVHFGVARPSDTPLQAHAWSICRGVVVTGEDVMGRFTPLAVFS